MTDPNPYRPTVSPVSDRSTPKRSVASWRSPGLAMLIVLAFWVLPVIVGVVVGMWQNYMR